MKILVINGPNLNRISNRNKNLYGSLNLSEIEKLIQKEFPEIIFSFLQSNIEGEIISAIQTASDNYDGILINPGGYAHTSVAIRDALEICTLPKVEVHLSNIADREDFRQTTLTAAKCNGYISGLREISYSAGVFSLVKLINRE